MRKFAALLLVVAGVLSAANRGAAQAFPDRAIQEPRRPATSSAPLAPPPLLQPPAAPQASAAAPAPEQRADALDALLRKLVLELLPKEYVDDDDWGQTEEFITGLDIERDGLKIETRRRRKQLNHGTWERYEVSLTDSTKFDLQVKNLRTLEDARLAFDVHLQLPLRVVARQSQWRRGVQLYSVHADAEMLVRVEVQCVTAIIIDTASFPPAIVMKPTVSAARARLADFELHRVSKLGGDAAEELGRAARGRIERRIAAKDEKLTRKINEQLAQREEVMRLSWASLAESGWKQFIDMKKKE